MRHAFYLALRDLRALWRQPWFVAVTLVQPLIWLLLFGELFKSMSDLPGFGDQKAKIFLALLGKQYGLTAPGWESAAGHYGEPGSFRSVADIVDAASLSKVREFKKAAKAAAKGS